MESTHNLEMGQAQHAFAAGHTLAADGHCIDCRNAIKGRPNVETMTDREMLTELVTATRQIGDALENFDPSSMFASLLGGGSDAQNPMSAILGALVRPS